MQQAILNALGTAFICVLAWRMIVLYAEDRFDRMIFAMVMAAFVALAIWAPDVLINALTALGKALPVIGDNHAPPPGPTAPAPSPGATLNPFGGATP